MAQTFLLNDINDIRYEISGSDKDLSIFQPIKNAGGRWESHIARVLGRLISPDDICLDIGANIGPFSLLMSDLAYNGQVHAFEPSPEIYAYLVQNARGNARSNLLCYPVGLSDSVEMKEFHTLKDIPGASFAGISADRTDVSTAVKEVFDWDFAFESAPVQFTTLDEWSRENHVDQVDFILIDVEGGELLAFRGGEQLLKRCRPTILTEFNIKAMRSYYSIEPSFYLYLLNSLYDYIYLVDETGLSPVMSYGDLEAALSEKHFWADLLCTTTDVRSIPSARNLLRQPPPPRIELDKSNRSQIAEVTEEPLKVAYLTVVPISWINNGGSLVCRSHLRELSQDPTLQVTAITIGPAELQEADKGFIEALGCEAHHIPLGEATASAKPPRETFLDVFLHQQELIARNYRGVDEAACRFVEEGGFDAIVVDWLFTACYVPSIFGLSTPATMITLNREAEFYALESSFSKHEFFSRAVDRLLQWRLSRLERSIYSSCQGIVALTSNDLPQSLSPDAAVAVIPPLLRGRATRWRHPGNKRVFFVGNFNHFPNRLAAEWICSKLAPEVEQIDGDVSFHLIGGDADGAPSEWLRKNTHILGVLDQQDVTRMFSSSALFIAPIENDFGCKIKILECLAHGIPFAATKAAMSGVPYLKQEPMIDLDDPKATAIKICSLLDDRKRLERMSASNEERLMEFKREHAGVWGRFLKRVVEQSRNVEGG